MSQGRLTCACWVRSSLRIVSVVLITAVMLYLLAHIKPHSVHDKVTRKQFVEAFKTFPTSLKPVFATKEDFDKEVALSDFFARMTPIDLKARSTPDTVITSTTFYRSFYTNLHQLFDDMEKSRINKLVQAANDLLKEYPNLRDIPWTFVKVRDLENNYPHTIGNMIVLNNFTMARPDQDLIKLFIHEKIHVFQRLENLATRQLVTSLHFKSLSPNERLGLPQEARDNLRANPDLDGHIYMHIPSRSVILQVYNSDAPTSLADSKPIALDMANSYQSTKVTNEMLGLPVDIECQLEHPFEIIACLIASLIVEPELGEKNKQNVYVDETLKWMSTHFVR